MSTTDATYVIFDGDNDMWAYGYMKGWKVNEYVNFDFRDAHDLDTMTSNAQEEAYVKSKLKERMKQSQIAVVLIGEKTKNLFKFVRWELELAMELGLPIIAVNLNEKRQIDTERCPAIIRDACVVHVPFKLAIIRYAMDNWPAQFRKLDATEKAKGARSYSEKVYQDLGL